jgi:hypothetical protein
MRPAYILHKLFESASGTYCICGEPLKSFRRKLKTNVWYFAEVKKKHPQTTRRRLNAKPISPRKTPQTLLNSTVHFYREMDSAGSTPSSPDHIRMGVHFSADVPVRRTKTLYAVLALLLLVIAAGLAVTGHSEVAGIFRTALVYLGEQKNSPPSR